MALIGATLRGVSPSDWPDWLVNFSPVGKKSSYELLQLSRTGFHDSESPRYLSAIFRRAALITLRDRVIIPGSR